MIVALLLACVGPEAGPAGVTGGVQEAPPTGQAAPPSTPTHVEACGGDNGWSQAEGTLPVSWCARVSPELGSITNEEEDPGAIGPHVGTLAPTAGSTAAAPPCGVENLVGALGLGGTAAAPAVLYCDQDKEGGVRFATYNPAFERIASTFVAKGDCSAVPGSGTLTALGEGWIVSWAGTTLANDVDVGGASGTYGIVAARLDASGSTVAGPVRVEVGEDIGHVDLAIGAYPLAVAVTWSGAVWLAPVPLGADPTLAAPAPQRLTSGAAEAAIVATGAGFTVATCADADGQLTLWQLDAVGAVLGSAPVAGATCGWSQRPSLVATAGGVVLGWTGPTSAGVAALGADLAEAWRYTPPGGATQVAALDDGVLVVTRDGTVSRLDESGVVVASAVHPALVDAEGSIGDLRLVVSGLDALFLTYGMSNYPTGGGHVDTFDYVEISAAPLP